MINNIFMMKEMSKIKMMIWSYNNDVSFIF